jgi:hypothetical protein
MKRISSMTARRIGEILGTNALLGGARALRLNLAGLRPLAERASALLAGTRELSRQVEDAARVNARLVEELAACNGTLAALQNELDVAKARGRVQEETIELLRKKVAGHIDAEQERRLSVLDETPVAYVTDTAPRLPAILLNTLPKSGSIYIMRTLAQSLSIEFFDKSIAFGYFPRYFMVPGSLERLRAGNVVRQEHFDATPLNIELCGRYVDRMVLQVRDPRQAMYSWAHHVNRLAKLAPDGVNYTIHQPPQGFYDWSFEQQLDWHIETHLVSLVGWLREWLAYEGRGGPIALLWTSYDELVADERALFQRILDFYEIPSARFVFRPAAKTIDNNFRAGDPDAWKKAFTAQQKGRCEEIIGADLLKHFGWAMLSPPA